MQKKPILTSTFSFEYLITSGALYVDKTQYFHRLVTNVSNCYFCSRPRRFGKSLAISIFENIFLGKKELFEGLYIASTDYDWQVFPVIHIDMARSGSTSAQDLFDSLMRNVKENAERYGVTLSSESPWLCFDELISQLCKKTGKKVVILIDEYDRPLTENINDAKTLEEVRNVLDSFYQIIKGQEPNERFVFMTGVTKFSKVSIFSKLNNLTDITMSREYACMFGYTQEELEENFAPYIDEHVRENNLDRTEFIAKIKKWYDGFKFHWKSETVYNPVSIGKFFENECEFQNFWFSTSTPTFITKLARMQRLTQEDIYDTRLSDASMNAFDLASFATGNISKEIVIQLLFQTGYLTIGNKIESSFDVLFSVRFPNYEVEVSFSRILFEVYSGIRTETAISYVANIIEAANEDKHERLIEIFKNFLAAIPYTIQIPQEKYYQSILFSIVKMCGMDISAEDATNKGRIDAVLDTPKYIYLFEFKIDQDAEIALEQIVQKEYFQKFIEGAKEKGKEIRCFGINFSSKERNITDWRVG